MTQQCLGLTPYRDGREVLLAFSEDAAIVSKDAKDRNTDSEALEIAKAANFAHWDSLDISNYLPRSLYPSVFEKFN